MLLATQCPYCFTSFRVANDQLKLHAGLVRCGACQQTFNGIEYLLAPGAKPARPPAIEPGIEATPPTEIPPTDMVVPEAFVPAQISISEVDSIAEPDPFAGVNSAENETFQSYAETTEQAQTQIENIGPSSSDALEFDLGDDAPDTPFAQGQIKVEPEIESNDDENAQTELSTQFSLVNPENNDETPFERQLEQEQNLDDKPEVDADIVDAEPIDQQELKVPVETGIDALNDEPLDEASNASADTEKPDFVIQAEKKQRRSWVVRLSMIIFSTLLFFALLAQSTYSLRNQIAAWFPQSKTILQETCKLARCRIELPTQIDVISIESNELQALSSDKNIFSLAIQLQNKSATLQAWPMLELILNDAKDKPVVRRIFTPADYLTNKGDLIKGFSAHSEQPIKLHFELSGAKAAGYHVGVFYP